MRPSIDALVRIDVSERGRAGYDKYRHDFSDVARQNAPRSRVGGNSHDQGSSPQSRLHASFSAANDVEINGAVPCNGHAPPLKRLSSPLRWRI
jgi:hypothetical protein